MKTYRVNTDYNTVIEIYKWLRANGDTSEYSVLNANYRGIEIKFINPELELKYIMKYDWRIS